jgi:hypothetical protein
VSRIFISYRREDASGHAGRLADHLVAQFGSGQVFMDVDTLEPGQDFVAAIEQAVGSCAVLLAVIGRSWLAATNPAGQRRLEQPSDYVRLEIEAALARNVRVIPVLVQDAPMPAAADLPEGLRPLARHHALELSDTRWRADLERLDEVLRKVLGPLPDGASAAGAPGESRPTAGLGGPPFAGSGGGAAVLRADAVGRGGYQQPASGGGVSGAGEAGRRPPAWVLGGVGALVVLLVAAALLIRPGPQAPTAQPSTAQPSAPEGKPTPPPATAPPTALPKGALTAAPTARPIAAATAPPTTPPRPTATARASATPAAPATATPPATVAASPLPQTFWTVCVWCDFGTHDPRARADEAAAELRAAGLPAAVLWSSDYPTLAPGYWVTYSGVFGTEPQAVAHRTAVARAGFSAATRLVSTRPAAEQPRDQAFWTAIAGSFATRGEAEAVRARMQAGGVTAAVLFSSDYASLNPGYWVAYAGRFSDRAGAEREAQRLRELGFSAAYAREVRR